MARKSKKSATQSSSTPPLNLTDNAAAARFLAEHRAKPESAAAQLQPGSTWRSNELGSHVRIGAVTKAGLKSFVEFTWLEGDKYDALEPRAFLDGFTLAQPAQPPAEEPQPGTCWRVRGTEAHLRVRDMLEGPYGKLVNYRAHGPKREGRPMGEAGAELLSRWYERCEPCTTHRRARALAPSTSVETQSHSVDGAQPTAKAAQRGAQGASMGKARSKGAPQVGSTWALKDGTLRVRIIGRERVGRRWVVRYEVLVGIPEGGASGEWLQAGFLRLFTQEEQPAQESAPVSTERAVHYVSVEALSGETLCGQPDAGADWSTVLGDVTCARCKELSAQPEVATDSAADAQLGDALLVDANFGEPDNGEDEEDAAASEAEREPVPAVCLGAAGHAELHRLQCGEPTQAMPTIAVSIQACGSTWTSGSSVFLCCLPKHHHGPHDWAAPKVAPASEVCAVLNPSGSGHWCDLPKGHQGEWHEALAHGQEVSSWPRVKGTPTAGEWDVIANYDRFTLTASGKTIAGRYLPEHVREERPEAEANFRLMAGAPRMAQALEKHVLPLLRGIVQLDKELPSAREVRECVAAVIFALQQAGKEVRHVG